MSYRGIVRNETGTVCEQSRTIISFVSNRASRIVLDSSGRNVLYLTQANATTTNPWPPTLPTLDGETIIQEGWYRAQPGLDVGL